MYRLTSQSCYLRKDYKKKVGLDTYCSAVAPRHHLKVSAVTTETRSFSWNIMVLHFKSIIFSYRKSQL